MKKSIFIIPLLAAMLSAVEANAQFGIGAGYNFETMTTKAGNNKNSDNLNGFYVEASYGINLAEGRWGSVALAPGLRYSYFGDAEKQDGVFGFSTTASINEHYLDIPINVKYAFTVARPVKVFAYAGPVFSIGLDSYSRVSLSGSNKEYSVTYHNYSGKIDTKGDETTGNIATPGIKDYGRFDLKVGIGAGVTLFDMIDVKVGYNIGMLNRYRGEAENYRIGTNVFTAGVAFNF